MMGFGVKTVSGEDLTHTGGAKLVIPGWFHVNVINVKDGLDVNDKPINGATIEIETLAGKANDTSVQAADLVGKTCELTFYGPDASDDDKKVERKNRTNTALLIATDLITPAQLGQDVDVDITQIVGRHLVLHLQYGRKKQTNAKGEDEWVEDKRYVQLAFSDVFHIDDPDANAVPRNAAALKFVKPEYRHKPDYFSFKAKKAAHVQPAKSDPPKDVSL